MWIPGVGDAPSNINPASSNTDLTNPAQFTRSTSESGEVFFSITLIPSDFTGFSADQIQELGMILKGDDWSDGQTSDYLTSISDGFTLVVDQPIGNYGFFESSQEISINVRTSETASIEILVDDIVIQSENNITNLNFSHTTINDGNVHIIKVNANNGTETISQSYSYTLTPIPTEEPLPSGLVDGINYHEDPTSASLVLRAPNKEHVFVIGDFNDWSLDSDYLMKKDGEVFWLEIDNLVDGKEYIFQYLVDGEIKIADPYAEKISSPFDDGEIISDGRYPNLIPYPSGSTSEAASFLQTNKADFQWSDFARPANEDLIIYELLIRDFTEERTFNAVIEKLDYLEDLGVNALELMPVQEFEGNLSWGYNPAFMFSVDKYYGTEIDFKTLVNEAHKRGMAVILDIVLNHHFGRNSLVRLYNEGLYGNPTSESPWFNTSAKHDFNVGYDINHESQYTIDYVERVIDYWLDEYNVDGYRFDLSKGFTQKNSLGNVGLWGTYDASRIAIWKRISDQIWENHPTAYVILEHFADNNEEKELADHGMMIWGNRNHRYISLGKGSQQSLTDVYHEGLGWNNPNLVGYMESHDEERFMWEMTKSNSISTEEALERAKLNTAFFLTIPGPKMLWQFGEFGYDEELNDDRLGIKPTRWEYLEDADRLKLFNLYKSLINLRTKTDYIKSENFQWDASGRVKTINITHPEVDIYIIGNFSTISQETNHNFSKTGTWYDYFSGQQIEVTQTDEAIELRSGKFFIYTSEPIDNYIEDQQIMLSAKKAISIHLVYPNPTHDLVSINGLKGSWTYQLFDEQGKVILSGKKEPNQNSISLKNLNSGVYYLDVVDENTSSKSKLIVR